MPELPPHYCARCQGICSGECQWAARKAYDVSRNDDPFRKLYSTARWRRLRVRVKARQPLCAVCGNKATEEIDHVIPARLWVAQGHDFWDEANLQGLCSIDHSKKSGRERNQ